MNLAKVAPRLVRFALVGGALTLLNNALYLFGLELGLHYLTAATLGWAVGVVASYFANKSFTFAQGRRLIWRQFAIHLAGYVLQLGLGLTGLYLLIGRLGLGEIAGWWLNLAAMAVFSFLYMQFVVYPTPSGTLPRRTQRSGRRSV